MKVKDRNFGREDSSQRGKKNDHLCRHQTKNIITLVKKGI